MGNGVLRRIAPFDRATRGIPWKQNFGSALGAADLHGLADVVEQVLRTLGRREVDLAKEIGEALRYRTLFVLLPEACLHFDLPEMKPVIRTHLTSLGVDSASQNFEDLVSAIKTICECIRTKIGGQGRKLGVSDVYHTFQHIYKKIMAEQGDRCRYCGVPLIYGSNLTLDHVAPWHIGGDPQDGSNWAFSCQDCNAGKDWWPYYSLHCTGFNWLDPRNSVELRKAARYGALVRDGICTRTGVGPTVAALAVVKRVPSGCWILDNLSVVRADLVNSEGLPGKAQIDVRSQLG